MNAAVFTQGTLGMFSMYDVLNITQYKSHVYNEQRVMVIVLLFQKVYAQNRGAGWAKLIII